MWFVLMLLVCVAVALVVGWLAYFPFKHTALLAVGAAALYLLNLYIITR